MLAPWEIEEKRPRNWFERMLWLYGRTFWVVFWAGASSFIVVVACIWVIARVSDKRGDLINDLCQAYLLGTFGFALTYAGKNGLVEAVHAKKGTAAHTQSSDPAPKRPSGNAVPNADGVP